MKIRFDFVTNSSSSSYVICRIDNKELAKLYNEVGLGWKIEGPNRSVIRERFDDEQADMTGPGGGSISEWLQYAINLSIFSHNNPDYMELVELLKLHKSEVDFGTRSADFSTVVSITDGYGSYYDSEERKGGKIISTGFGEEDWDYEKEGCYIDEFIIGSQEDNRRKAKELCGTRIIEDPWFKSKDISGIFNSPEGFSFDGHVVCLTGDFDFGPKSKVTEYIKNHGGTVSSSVTKKTTVVLTGNKGSSAWSHGNYGTKIEKAIIRRETGDNIIILKETKELFANEVPKEKTETKREPVVTKQENKIGLGLLANMMAYLQSEEAKRLGVDERLKLENIVISKEMQSILGTDLKHTLSSYKTESTEYLRQCIQFLNLEADRDAVSDYYKKMREAFTDDKGVGLLLDESEKMIREKECFNSDQEKEGPVMTGEDYYFEDNALKDDKLAMHVLIENTEYDDGEYYKEIMGVSYDLECIEKMISELKAKPETDNNAKYYVYRIPQQLEEIFIPNCEINEPLKDNCYLVYRGPVLEIAEEVLGYFENQEDAVQSAEYAVSYLDTEDINIIRVPLDRLYKPAEMESGCWDEDSGQFTFE